MSPTRFDHFDNLSTSYCVVRSTMPSGWSKWNVRWTCDRPVEMSSKGVVLGRERYEGDRRRGYERGSPNSGIEVSCGSARIGISID
jgi:hypothetical protein